MKKNLFCGFEKSGANLMIFLDIFVKNLPFLIFAFASLPKQ